MTAWLLFVVVSIILLAGAGMAALVVVLVRRSSPPAAPAAPIAAPGRADRHATAARLVADLDDAATRATTALQFARLQLTSAAPAELDRAIAEARTSVTDLSTALAESPDGEPHGPAGTASAGRLTSALQRADTAARQLAAAEARVREESRRLGPPPTT